MSLTLLKKSLEILEDWKDGPAKDKKDEAKVNNRKTPSKEKQKAKRDAESLLKNHRRVRIKDVRQKMNLGEKKSKENLKRLLALSKNTLKEADAEKLVKRAHKGRYEDIELPKPEIESIFTEDDFRNFEEEYFKS